VQRISEEIPLAVSLWQFATSGQLRHFSRKPVRSVSAWLAQSRTHPNTCTSEPEVRAHLRWHDTLGYSAAFPRGSGTDGVTQARAVQEDAERFSPTRRLVNGVLLPEFG